MLQDATLTLSHIKDRTAIQKPFFNGFEALARLRMEELGQIGPDEFIALAEEKLLIFDLGHRILKLA